jgi:hypothetical protein
MEINLMEQRRSSDAESPSRIENTRFAFSEVKNSLL